MPDDAWTSTRWRSTSRGGAVVVACGFIALTTAVATRFGPVVSGDEHLSDAARRFSLAHPLWLASMRVITEGGSSSVLVPIGLVMLGVALWRRKEVWLPVAVVVTTTALRLTVRAGIARPRPVDRLARQGGWAYPSGHTTASALMFVVVVVFALQLVSARRHRAMMISAVGVLAILVGVSRVALVVHWPTDVLGAWLLVGTVVLALPQQAPDLTRFAAESTRLVSGLRRRVFGLRHVGMFGSIGPGHPLDHGDGTRQGAHDEQFAGGRAGGHP